MERISQNAEFLRLSEQNTYSGSKQGFWIYFDFHSTTTGFLLDHQLICREVCFVSYEWGVMEHYLKYNADNMGKEDHNVWHDPENDSIIKWESDYMKAETIRISRL